MASTGPLKEVLEPLNLTSDLPDVPHDPGPKEDSTSKVSQKLYASSERVKPSKEASKAEGTDEVEVEETVYFLDREYGGRPGYSSRCTPIPLCPKSDPFTYIKHVNELIANDDDINDIRYGNNKQVRQLYRFFGMERDIEQWPRARDGGAVGNRLALVISLFKKVAEKILGDYTITNQTINSRHDRLIALLEVCGSVVINGRVLHNIYTGRGPGCDGLVFLPTKFICSSFTTDIISDISWGKDNGSIMVYYVNGEKEVHHLEPCGREYLKNFIKD